MPAQPTKETDSVGNRRILIIQSVAEAWLGLYREERKYY